MQTQHVNLIKLPMNDKHCLCIRQLSADLHCQVFVIDKDGKTVSGDAYGIVNANGFIEEVTKQWT